MGEQSLARWVAKPPYEVSSGTQTGPSEGEPPHVGSQHKPGLVPAGTTCSFPAIFPNAVSSAKNSWMESQLRSAQSRSPGAQEGGESLLREGHAAGVTVWAGGARGDARAEWVSPDKQPAVSTNLQPRSNLKHKSLSHARSSLAPPAKERRNTEMTLAAQGSVKPIGGVSVCSSAPGFYPLTGKIGAKLPWVLHLSEKINISESRSDLGLKIWTLLILGYTGYTG